MTVRAMSLLTLDDVGRSFGAIQALTGVNLRVAAGEVVGLMGDNGAGKSTLAKIIAGNFPPTSGRMSFNGQDVHFARPVEGAGRRDRGRLPGSGTR